MSKLVFCEKPITEIKKNRTYGKLGGFLVGGRGVVREQLEGDPLLGHRLDRLFEHLRVLNAHAAEDGEALKDVDVIHVEGLSIEFVHQLRHADDLARGIANGHAEDAPVAEAGLIAGVIVHVGVKTGVRVGVGNVERLAGAGDVAGDADVDGEATLKRRLVQFLKVRLVDVTARQVEDSREAEAAAATWAVSAHHRRHRRCLWVGIGGIAAAGGGGGGGCGGGGYGARGRSAHRLPVRGGGEAAVVGDARLRRRHVEVAIRVLVRPSVVVEVAVGGLLRQQQYLRPFALQQREGVH